MQMQHTSAADISDAILYEGYLLYPYRASATKNRQRFTFGRVYPRAYSLAQSGMEPCLMQAECLVRREAASASVTVSLRFLQPTSRTADRTPEARSALSPTMELDSSSTAESHPGQNAVERRVTIPSFSLDPSAPAECPLPFSVPGSCSPEDARNHHPGSGSRPRGHEALAGLLEVTMQPVDATVSRLSVRIRNETPMSDTAVLDPESVLLRTFASTHFILSVERAEFLSLTTPPSPYEEAANACRNIGSWPVLVGDETAGHCITMVAAPIILYDFPRLAPESAGDLFDGTEIDELLTLRIQTLTEAEKQEVRQGDPRVRQLLERTEALSEENLSALHGSMRQAASFDETIFGAQQPLESVLVGGRALRPKDRVRIRPKAGGDILDMVLTGKTAVIEAIEQDAEGRILLALVAEEDPGKDLGLLRQPGHRFFYGPDELEALPEVP